MSRWTPHRSELFVSFTRDSPPKRSQGRSKMANRTSEDRIDLVIAADSFEDWREWALDLRDARAKIKELERINVEMTIELDKADTETDRLEAKLKLADELAAAAHQL